MIDWYSEWTIERLSYVMLIAAAGTVAAMLTGLKAHYGRYAGEGGITIPAWLGWMVQESPSFIIPFLAFSHAKTAEGRAVIVLFLLHYFNRTFIYPFLLKNPKPSPISIVLSAIVFCIWNGHIQGYYHALYYQPEPDHFSQPLTLIGITLFFGGMAINCQSDHILRNLRKPGDSGYKIPKGGMFEYVSGANFFGECVEWIGYAMVAQTLPAAAFAVFTISNIGPRAIQHHQWYHSKFRNYPKKRKAIIPFLL